MRPILIIAALFYTGLSFAAAPAAPTAPAAAEEWNESTLSDALIAKIQAASYEYKLCASNELQKPDTAKLDVRTATDTIIKKCEPSLGKMREAYLSEKVPAVIADRHLKTIRIQTARKLLSELIFRDAARKAGAQ